MQLTRPRVTCVIPTFRRPEMLQRAIESALNQTFRDLIVLVLDNASGDGTGDVVRALQAQDARVQYICHPTNIGPMLNFQAGMSAVTTPYFSFLSDDDMLLPHFYATALAALSAEPQARFFCGQVVIFNPGQQTHKVTPRRGWRDGLYAAGAGVLPMTEAHFSWSSILFETGVRETAGPLMKTDFADMAFLLKAMSACAFWVQLKPFSLYTAWDKSLTGRSSLEEFLSGSTQIFEALQTQGRLQPEHLATVRKNLEAKAVLSVCHRLRLAFDGGDWDAVVRAATYLRSVGALSGWLKARATLAQPGWRDGWLRRLFSSWLNRRNAWRQARRLKRARRAGISAEQLVAQYSPPSAAAAWPGAFAVPAADQPRAANNRL